MKKLWLIFPALLIAGLVMMGCPTDDPGGDDGIGWSLSQDADNDTVKTTKNIIITFDSAVELDPSKDFTVGGLASRSGNIQKGSDGDGDGKIWYVPVDVTGTGNATVKLSKSGVKAGTKSVKVWKEGSISEDDYDFTTLSVTWLSEAGAENKKGNIEGETFRDIKYSKQDSFVRVTIKLQSDADGTWGSGKFGEFAGEDFMIPGNTGTGAEVYVDIPVADILDAIGDDADYIFINIWNASIVKVELAETKTGSRPEKPVQYTVSFDLDGGTYGEEALEELPDLKIDKDQTLGTRFPALYPLKDNFHFTSWKDSAGTAYTATTEITANVALTAQYESGAPPNYTVTFALDGGTPAVGSTIDAVTVVEGQAMGDDFPSVPIRKEGQWFVNWKTENDVYTASTPILATITLTAQWIENTQPAAKADLTVDGYKFKTRIYNDWGGDMSNRYEGKGNIGGVDLEAIQNADNTDILIFYLYNTSNDNRNWGVGGLENAAGTRVDISTATSAIAGKTAGYARVNISALSTLNVSSQDYLFVNIWSECIVQKIEIWEVDDEFVPPTSHNFTVTLEKNGAYGHQGQFYEPEWLFNGAKIESGDVYIATFDAVISTAVSYVNLVLVDNGQANTEGGSKPDGWGWTVISGYNGTSAIGTETPTACSVTITATGSATDNTVASNKLVFQTGSDDTGTVDGNITLTITNFTFVKQEE